MKTTKEIPTSLTSEEVWNSYSTEVKRYIRSKVKDSEMTNDLLQEVFIKVHLNLQKVQKTESLRSWIFSIAYNTVMNHFAKPTNMSLDGNMPEETTTEEQRSPISCLLPMIKNLPELYREPLIQSEINGKKQAEVAEILKMTLPAVKSRIQRGRRLLQEGFMECCHYRLNDKGFLVGEHQEKEDCRICGKY